MIPKIIHYVWLGGSPLNPLGKHCLESWQKHLPGWRIHRWDESNSPIAHPYVSQMLGEKKYAFASDYVRLQALADYGGIYLDTDMELCGDVQPILSAPCVLAFLSSQNRPSKNSVALGFIAAAPSHPWILELLAEYQDLRKAIMNTTLATHSLRKKGLRDLRDHSPHQDFWDLGDVRIYHSEYFYSSSLPTHPGRAIGFHHAEGSWAGQESRLPVWKTLLDYRWDRKILRPLEKGIKKFTRRTFL